MVLQGNSEQSHQSICPDSVLVMTMWNAHGKTRWLQNTSSAAFRPQHRLNRFVTYEDRGRYEENHDIRTPNLHA
jgi:hypothetical protein